MIICPAQTRRRSTHVNEYSLFENFFLAKELCKRRWWVRNLRQSAHNLRRFSTVCSVHQSLWQSESRNVVLTTTDFASLRVNNSLFSCQVVMFAPWKARKNVFPVFARNKTAKQLQKRSNLWSTKSNLFLLSAKTIDCVLHHLPNRFILTGPRALWD